MTQMEIDTLEHAGRAAMVWTPQAQDGRFHFGAVLAAIVPAISILAVAAAFLFVAS